MKLILFFLVLSFQVSSAQYSDVFELSKKGTAKEAEDFFKSNTVDFNTVSSYGFTPLIMATYYGNEEMVDFLIEKKADLDYVSPEGTALMAATVKGNQGIVEKLLKKGANPDLTNKNGMTALMYAVQFENKEIIKLLLHYKVDVFKKNSEGKTAFEYAVTSKNTEIINLLKQKS